ncbi:NADH-quinone oxidoreductase subunit L [Iamia sp. SCSIO 61187]|uniref:NADH-quinone oxidoreductase subunit 5 family protein n=1 Tax=Iamia sp. SCSIO 61187 TaxID=2722752 RepID=UPI001C636A9E|nr:NADH-quinone oxidoreductase subunit L [Iamia sp. SCSIO 61187]QYG94801.1 NADH-quinone oxidoreductase subunit L [Iamia sp. SCSIO 61187]
MLTHAFIIPLIMAVSFVAILAVGKRLPRGGAEIGIAAISICFVLAIATGVGWVQRVNHPPEAEHATEEAVDPDDEIAYALTTAEEPTGHGEEAGATEEGAAEGGATEEGAAEEGAAEEESHEYPPVVRKISWLQTGGFDIKVGTLVDGLSVLMLLVVTLVSGLVHVYSSDYVAGDRRFTHYYAFLSLFTASMLMFVLSQNVLQMIVGWELVGLCSFALIGHWWEEKPNSDAALKAFLTNRVGDVGLLVGMIILYFAAGDSSRGLIGSFDILRITTMANTGQIDHLVLLVASLCLIAAVMSKSGQFILHTWLPDAMAGPTPVSALIHAATMVVAGIYMVARLYPVFWHGLSIGSANINALAVVGTITLFLGALLAFVQSDIKKVLAYSTVSQLGFMVMALGVGAWTAAIFHLFTHAMFKACLFLGAGSMSHANHHSFDMKKDYGGLRKHMPWTFRTFVIGTAALAGLFPLAGFWSKDEILAGAGQLGGKGGYQLMLVVGTLGAMCTAAYMTRAIYYCFFGEPRGAAKEHTPHESGPRIVIPLVILAGLAIVAGFANIPDTGLFSGLPEGVTLRFEHYVEPRVAWFPYADQTVGDVLEHPEFSLQIALTSTLLALLAAGLVYLWYWKGAGPHGITQRNKAARAGYRLLEQKYYLDALYTGAIAGGVKGPIARGANWVNQNIIDGVVNVVGTSATAAGRWIYKNVDQGGIDLFVKGSGAGAEGTGQLLRKGQTGKVQTYGAYLFGAATVLAAVFVVIASTS